MLMEKCTRTNQLGSAASMCCMHDGEIKISGPPAGDHVGKGSMPMDGYGMELFRKGIGTVSARTYLSVMYGDGNGYGAGRNGT